SPQQAGVPFNVRVEARDTWDNVLDSGVNAYAENEATLVDNGPDGLVVTSPVTLDFGGTAGIWEGTVTISGVNTGVNQVTLRAEDTVGPTTVGLGDSNAFTVDSGPLDHFVYTTNPGATETAGGAIAVFIEARDSNDNLVDTYVGPAVISDTTGTISEGSAGGGVTSIVFIGGEYDGTGGTLYITEADTGISITVSDGGYTGASSTFTVQPGVANHFTVVTSISSPQQAGVPFNVRVEARDTWDNVLDSGVNAYAENEATLVDNGPD
ncbi:unnamed protein product, partial [marine sediment metagenome]